MSSTNDPVVEASQFASDEALLHFSYSQVIFAFLAPSTTSTQPSNVALIAGSDIQKSKSSSGHLDSVCSRRLTSERNVFVGRLEEFSTKIECANVDYFLAQREGKIRLSCLKEDGSASSTTINDVSYIPEAKANLLSLGQLSERGVYMKSTCAKMYLHRKGKTVMTGSKIGRVWLMNSINWPMIASSAREVIKKALKKGKNDILHVRLGYMSETNSKRIASMVDDIDGDPTKICFCESCINAKITRNPSTKPMSQVTTKLGRMHMDL